MNLFYQRNRCYNKPSFYHSKNYSSLLRPVCLSSNTPDWSLYELGIFISLSALAQNRVALTY